MISWGLWTKISHAAISRRGFGAQLLTKMPLVTWKETQETHLKRWRHQLQLYRSFRHFKVYFRRSRATDALKLGRLLQSNTVKT